MQDDLDHMDDLRWQLARLAAEKSRVEEELLLANLTSKEQYVKLLNSEKKRKEFRNAKLDLRNQLALQKEDERSKDKRIRSLRRKLKKSELKRAEFYRAKKELQAKLAARNEE